MSMDSDQSDITADFIIEAQEILDRLGEQLVQLEHTPDDLEQINAVFRGFHTLKGGAGFLSLNAMVILCHAAEETLGVARSGKTILLPRHFDAAQQSLDHLQRMLDELAMGQMPLPAPESLIAQFNIDDEMLAAPKPLVTAEELVNTPASDLISDDEFEALLDELQGLPPTNKADAAPVSPLIQEDEFESMLDQIHGTHIPGEVVLPMVAVSVIEKNKAEAKAAIPEPVAEKVGAGELVVERFVATKPGVLCGKTAPAVAPARPVSEAEHTVRVDTKRLDAIVNLIGELVLSRNRLKALRTRLHDEELDRAVSSLDIATARLQSAVMRTRMQPVGKVFSRFPKMTRDVARTLHKEVELELMGADTELDRNLVEALADPLVHLVRNAIDHGVESPSVREAAGKPRVGKLKLSAQQEGDYVCIEIQDDGAGIDPERLRAKAREKGLLTAEAASRMDSDECLHLVFLPGFSTKTEVTDISGRGVGMDVVQSRIRELNGQIQIQSELGRGTRFIIRVPLTLAILSTLLVEAEDTIYALPLARVMEVLHAPASALRWFDSRPVLDRKSSTLALIELRQWLHLPNEPTDLLTIVVLNSGENRFGLVVDQVHGREEVVIKPLPKQLRGLLGYAGATLIGDGRMALILDVDGLHGSTH